jgi:hypothetical protein
MRTVMIHAYSLGAVAEGESGREGEDGKLAQIHTNTHHLTHTRAHTLTHDTHSNPSHFPGIPSFLLSITRTVSEMRR